MRFSPRPAAPAGCAARPSQSEGSSLLLLALLLVAGCAGGAESAGTGAGAASAEERPPNIIFIVADDLGYGEIAPYGQEKIRTPHLAQMAREGMRFRQFYAGSPVCAPSRATLLTGRHTGHTYIRDNYGLGGYRDSTERGQLAQPAGTETIGTMLQEAGYTTAAIGKWGLGGPGSEGLPPRQGFDFFYGYLDQKQAHNYYPTHLWQSAVGDSAVVWDTLRNDYLEPQQQLAEAPPGDPVVYGRYLGTDYAPTQMHEETLGFIRAHQDEPFFLYRASVIPHVALQVPADEVQAYDFAETPYLGQNKYLPHPRPRAAYAALISLLDRQVGEILDLLGELGLAENTLVVFTSDNGPTYVGGVDYAFFDSNGRFRGRKGAVYEGGVRVPMIARWPRQIPAGTASGQVGALWDMLPTAADLAGATPPERIDGVSLWPAMQKNGELGGERPALYWEYYGLCDGQQALRDGKWKAVRMGVSADGDAPVELYDLKADPDESDNVAAAHPDVARRLGQQMREAHTPSPIERWSFAEATGPLPLARGTPQHACLPWMEDETAGGGGR